VNQKQKEEEELVVFAKDLPFICVVEQDLTGKQCNFLRNFYRRLFTTKIVSSNPDHDGMYSIQHYVIKVLSDLLQVGSFHRVEIF
jgi:hypothetical protein